MMMTISILKLPTTPERLRGTERSQAKLRRWRSAQRITKQQICTIQLRACIQT
jgi:hypothetical protein